MTAIKIEQVQQPTPNTCVHACLSMVTGLPIDGLIKRFGKHGLDSDDEATVLTEMGILPVLLPNVTTPLFLIGSAFFLTVASLNLPGRQHLIVVEANGEGDLIVYDPNTNREGGRWYPLDALQPSRETVQAGGVLHGYSNIMLLQPLRKHKGSKERRRLYRRRAKPSDSGTGENDG